MKPDSELSEPGTEYLSDLSPRDQIWDKQKWRAEQVKKLYQGTIFDRLAGRIGICSGCLGFGWVSDHETGEKRLKLTSCRFCRVRHCPLCQWRRSLMWIARFLKALPSINRDHPKARYLFLTLTVKNCPLEELRATLKHMNATWKRLTQRKEFPAIGFARATEVTKGRDSTAHPHFHVLLMVKESYFQGKYYLSQEQWTELWRSCLQVDYTPIVDVRAVRPNKKHGTEALPAALVEVFKYSVKPDDLFGTGSPEDRQWLVELTSQLQKTRAIALGGVLKNYLSESEPEDLLTEAGDEEVMEQAIRIFFGYKENLKRYARIWKD